MQGSQLNYAHAMRYMSMQLTTKQHTVPIYSLECMPSVCRMYDVAVVVFHLDFVHSFNFDLL